MITTPIKKPVNNHFCLSTSALAPPIEPFIKKRHGKGPGTCHLPWTHSHELIVPDDLHGHLLVGPGVVPGSNDVAEDALAGVAVHIVTLVQDLSYVHT